MNLLFRFALLIVVMKDESYSTMYIIVTPHSTFRYKNLVGHRWSYWRVSPFRGKIRQQTFFLLLKNWLYFILICLAFIGSRIFTVTATGPQDISDIVYSIVGASPAPTYFAIDVDGRITVRTDLTQDNNKQYQVCCHTDISFEICYYKTLKELNVIRI